MRRRDIATIKWLATFSGLALLSGCSTLSTVETASLEQKQPRGSVLAERIMASDVSRTAPFIAKANSSDRENALTTEVAWMGGAKSRSLRMEAPDDCSAHICLARLPRYPVKTLPPAQYYAETARCVIALFEPEKTGVEISFASPVEGGAIVEFELGGLGKFLALRDVNKYEQYTVQVSYSKLEGQSDTTVEVVFEEAKIAYFEQGYFNFKKKPSEDRLGAYEPMYEGARKKLANDISKHLGKCVGNG